MTMSTDPSRDSNTGALAVPVLPVADLARSLAWYGRLGFGTVAEYDRYAILSFAGAEVHLATHDDAPAANTSLSGAYLRVADADAVHAGWSAVGARIIDGPLDQSYGIREFATEDLDGNLWRVGSPIASADHDLGHDGHHADGDDQESQASHDGHTGRETAAADQPSAGTDGRDGDAVDTATAPADQADSPVPTDGSAGTGDAAWATVAAADVACAGCALQASAGTAEAVRAEILAEAERWARAIGEADDDAMRIRPDEHTWSALEYAFHVRGVFGVFTERIALTLVETNPELSWWDQDAAIDDGMANELDAALVVDDLRRTAENLADVLAQVNGAAWERPATRRGESFTVESMARYAWHEAVHHRVDAEETLATVSR